jgi:hypothetical protein
MVDIHMIRNKVTLSNLLSPYPMVTFKKKNAYSSIFKLLVLEIH